MLIRLYRISNWLHRHKVPVIPKMIYGLNYMLFNCIVPPQCTIGKNTRFAYHGIGVVIHRDAVIGENCMIGQGVTIGGKAGHSRLPVIGDNVYIAAGSRIIGSVNIGNDVIIGCNSVVLHA
ncbi:MAG: serine acetyltransferase, partial [Paramuribaculum sp.]|nr:serine acetyltransferase [Paramuribaculum sp.]